MLNNILATASGIRGSGSCDMNFLKVSATLSNWNIDKSISESFSESFRIEALFFTAI
jgi:hypothetical protein